MLTEIVGKKTGNAEQEICLEGGIEQDFLGQNHSLHRVDRKMAVLTFANFQIM